jgi:predicted SAM-dependent methyltransferase
MNDPQVRVGPDLSLRKINLGCGFDKRPGYLNVDLNDFHGPDWVADISDLSDFPADYYEEIVAQDVLEHMTRIVSKKAFIQWARILSPTGVMKVRIPSMIGLLGLIRDHPWTAEAHDHIMHLMFGTQAYNGDFHLSGFTPPILIKMAEDAGVMITRAIVKDHWLYDLEFCRLREPTHEEFLHAAYFRYLGRTIDPDGLVNWAAMLAEKRSSREEVVAALCSSSEAGDRSQRMV